MRSVLEVVSVTLAALALAPALAHVLELPGKLHLPEETYVQVQTIYYPGFTIAGIAEPAAIVATLALILLTPPGSVAFALLLGALGCLVAMQLVFWLVVQPVNKHWVARQPLGRAGAGFFALGGITRAVFPSLRSRWEGGHAVRAALALIALLALIVAMTR
jgi:hypothetical protein